MQAEQKRFRLWCCIFVLSWPLVAGVYGLVGPFSPPAPALWLAVKLIFTDPLGQVSLGMWLLRNFVAGILLTDALALCLLAEISPYRRARTWAILASLAAIQWTLLVGVCEGLFRVRLYFE